MSTVVVLLKCDHESSQIVSVHEGSKENKKRMKDRADQLTKEAEQKKQSAIHAKQYIPLDAMCWYEIEIHQVNS